MIPKPISAILDSPVFQLVARLALLTTFIAPGLMQLVNFNQTLGEFTFFHLQPSAAFVVASIITLLVGSALVLIGGRWTWLGAGALGIYTGLTIFIVHHFWTMSGDARLGEMRTFFEHVSLIGGLMVVAQAQNGRRAAALGGSLNTATAAAPAAE